MSLWRITYMGEGVQPTPVGAFSKYTTAYVAEEVARSYAGQGGWVVADPSGNEVGAGAPRAEKRAEEKRPEAADKKADDKKPEDKKPEDKKAEKKPEAADKKADDKKSEKAEAGEKKK